MRYYIVEKDEWKPYFDFISKLIQGHYIELEVSGPEIGDQIVQEWTFLDGLSYDPKDDELHIHTRTLGQVILGPKVIVTSDDGVAINSITAKDLNGNVQIIHFRAPLMLPPPHRS